MIRCVPRRRAPRSGRSGRALPSALALLVALTVPACGPGTASVTGAVVLMGVAGQAGIPVVLAGDATRTTVTGAGGGWRLPRVAPGRYAVVVSVPSTREGTQSTSVEVSASEPALAPTLTFTPLGALAGRVLAPGGTPVAQATVAVAGEAADATTGADGRYRLLGVPVGPVTVVAELAGVGRATAPRLSVAWNRSTPVPDLTLAPPRPATASVSGTVRLPGVADRHGLTVTLAGPVTLTTVTAADGGYAFQAIPGGLYTVTAAGAATVEGSVSASFQVPGSGRATAPPLTLTPVGEVTGVVTLDDRVARYGGIAVVLSGAGRATAVFTDDGGHFDATRAPVGPVTLTAVRGGYQPGTEAIPAVAYAGTTAAPPLRLAPGGPGTGGSARVHGVCTVVGHTGSAGVTVTLSNGLGTLPPATTDADGAFTVPGVPTGIYTASFDDGAYHETLPWLLALPGENGLVLGGATVAPLDALEVSRARRIGAYHGGSRGGILDAHHFAYLTPRPTLKMGDEDLHVLSFDGAAPVTVHGILPRAQVRLVPGGVIALVDEPTGSIYDHGATHRLLRVDLASGAETVLAEGVAPGSMAVAPDGSRVAWLAQAGLAAGTWSLESAPLSGGPPATLASGVGRTALSFSPDGGSLLFLGAASASGTGRDLDLVPAAGGTAVAVASGVQGILGVTSPDGQATLFTYAATGAATSPALGLLRFDTRAVVKLAPSVATWGVAFSPDGRQVLFADAAGALHVVPAAGGTGVTLVPAGQDVQSRWFSGDGTHVLYLAGSPYALPNLAVVPVTGGPATVLGTGVPVGTVMRSPAGDQVAFFTALDATGATGTLYRAALDGTPALKVAAGVPTARLQFTAHTGRLVFVDGSGTLESLAPGAQAPLALMPGAAGDRVVASPDGQRVYVVHGAGTGPGLVTGTLSEVAVDGGPAVPIAGQVVFGDPVGFGTSGTRVVFVRVQTDQTGRARPTLEMAPATGGTLVPIVADPGQVWWLGSRALVMATGLAPFEAGYYLAPLD